LALDLWNKILSISILGKNQLVFLAKLNFPL